MIVPFALVVLGGVAFAMGLLLDGQTWLIAAGLVLLPAGVIWGLAA